MSHARNITILTALLVLTNWGCKEGDVERTGISTIGTLSDPNEQGLVEFDVTGGLDGETPGDQRTVGGVQLDVLTYSGKWEFIKQGQFTVRNAFSQASGSTMTFKSAFSRFVIDFQPPNQYPNPGKVNFAVDGAGKGTLDLATYNPLGKGYAVPYVIEVADTLKTHTVRMTLATGSVSIYGYQATFSK